MNAAAAVGEAANIAVSYVDEKTGKVVSSSWATLSPDTQAAIKGGAIVASFVIPSASISKIKTALKGKPGGSKPGGSGSGGPNAPNKLPDGRPINFDGEFYSVDGFKFSERYYRYLYDNGRPAPFLQAREVLNSNPKITPDPQGAPGFFRYEGGGLEMIYNPTTGQVGHLQPIR